MNPNSKKGTCADCKVCKAYLREAGRHHPKPETVDIAGEKPALSHHTAESAATGLNTSEKPLPREDGNCGCPAARSPK